MKVGKTHCSPPHIDEKGEGSYISLKRANSALNEVDKKNFKVEIVEPTLSIDRTVSIHRSKRAL